MTAPGGSVDDDAVPSPIKVLGSVPTKKELTLYNKHGYGAKKLIDTNPTLINGLVEPLLQRPIIDGFAFHRREHLSKSRQLPETCLVTGDQLDRLWHPYNFRMFGGQYVAPSIEAWGTAPTPCVENMWYPFGYQIKGIECTKSKSAKSPTIIVGIASAFSSTQPESFLVELESCWRCRAKGINQECTIVGCKVAVGGDCNMKISVRKESAVVNAPTTGSSQKRPQEDMESAERPLDIAKKAKLTLVPPSPAGTPTSQKPSSTAHGRSDKQLTEDLLKLVGDAFKDALSSKNVNLQSALSFHRASAQGHDKALSGLRQDRNRLRDQLDKEKKERADCQNEIEQLQSGLQQRTQQLEEAEKENRALKEEIEQLKKTGSQHKKAPSPESTAGPSSISGAATVYPHARDIKSLLQRLYTIQGRDVSNIDDMTAAEQDDELHHLAENMADNMSDLNQELQLDE